MCDLDKLKEIKKTTQDEYFIAVIDFEIEIKEAERDIAIAKKALFLMEVYRRNGEMTIMLKDGKKMTDRPALTDNPKQNVWNLRRKAKNMASMEYDSATY